MTQTDVLEPVPQVDRSPGISSARAPWRTPAVLFACLALIGLLHPLTHAWAAQAVVLVLLVVVPGILALRALRVPGAVVAGFPVYVPCASLSVLFVAGLAVDLIGPVLGISQP